MIDEEVALLDVLDTAGQEEYSSVFAILTSQNFTELDHHYGEIEQCVNNT